MHWWLGAATVAAAAFVGSLTAFLLSVWFPGLEGPARSVIVGSGSMLAAFIVAGLHAALERQVHLDANDTRPLVSMHPRHR